MAGSRFVAAGTMLWFLMRQKGGANANPTRQDWFWAFIIGALMLLAGNGFLSIAEQEMPTGVGALLIASVPLWIVVFEFFQGASKPRLLVFVGLAAGFLGVALLANNKAGWASGKVNLFYVFLVLAGSAAWAFGSLLSRKGGIKLPLLRAVAIQMIAGGLLMVVAGIGLGESRGFHLAGVTTSSFLAWLYLVMFGSILAFSCYSWLLRVTPPAVAGTYAFVNPLVAVAIGAIVLGERITWTTGAAMVLIIVAVALITFDKARAARQLQSEKAPPAA